MLKMFKRERQFLSIFVLFFLSSSNFVNCGHFVLVHGAFHGAWCWYKVATQLKSAGHNVTTLDMAASGINPRKTQEVLSISEYHEPLMEFMGSLPSKEKVILVGHSLGGLSVSVAMEKYPKKIHVVVFLAANVVSENLTQLAFLEEARKRSLGSVLDTQYFIFDGEDKPPMLSSVGREFFASRMYQLSPAEDLTLAFSLLRPLPPIMNNTALLAKQTAVTKEKNGRVPKVFFITEKDNIVLQDFQEWIIERSGPYAKVKLIKNSDHMAMLSKPKKISSELLKIT
ncbi:methyl jasmonate esterase 1-like isoform X1 [Lotus japonicus]|uniref:methyl jasmonate esterase 1-like isoform X1 n=1 Tax=Lotus japonicus TaxID=34305 RepID=UPI0025852C6E|nr:methyl jasmonate esterase 1-like isoform X1 [Lotus japonicus]